MRRELIATTALIALAAILVLGIPLGVVESARAHGDAVARLEREADGVLAGERMDPGHAAVFSDGRRLGRIPSGATISARSGASQGLRVTVFAPAGEVTRRQRAVWLLIAVLAVAGTAAAAGLAVLQARRFSRPLERLVVTSDRLGAGDFSARTGTLELPEFNQVASALDAAAAQIAQLVGRQREFAANVSHQLKSPLTAMRLRLDELMTLEDPAEARQELAATLRVADRLERTVNDLLTLARAGGLGEPRDLDLAEVARRHASDWQPLYARAGRRLVTDIHAPLPARFSPGGVATAIDVLLENAIAHGSGTTRLTAESVDGRSVLAVQDAGPGVAPGSERAIFERAVSTANSTGLGLPLARALVESDGGRLIHAGAARFEIVLPRPRARSEAG